MDLAERLGRVLIDTYYEYAAGPRERWDDMDPEARCLALNTIRRLVEAIEGRSTDDVLAGLPPHTDLSFVGRAPRTVQ